MKIKRLLTGFVIPAQPVLASKPASGADLHSLPDDEPLAMTGHHFDLKLHRSRTRDTAMASGRMTPMRRRSG
jgi:hypothetical protein